MSERFQEFTSFNKACEAFVADPLVEDICSVCNHHKKAHGRQDTLCTIDMEAVIAFEPSEYAQGVLVYLSGNTEGNLRCTYADFKKLHSAYHASKQPVSIVSQWSLPPSDLPMGKLTTTPTGEWTDPTQNKPKKR